MRDDLVDHEESVRSGYCLWTPEAKKQVPVNRQFAAAQGHRAKLLLPFYRLLPLASELHLHFEFKPPCGGSRLIGRQPVDYSNLAKGRSFSRLERALRFLSAWGAASIAFAF
jgi:hypothetical protein